MRNAWNVNFEEMIAIFMEKIQQKLERNNYVKDYFIIYNFYVMAL